MKGGDRARGGIRILCAGAKLAQTLRAASLVSCKSGTIAAAWSPALLFAPLSCRSRACRSADRSRKYKRTVIFRDWIATSWFSDVIPRSDRFPLARLDLFFFLIHGKPRKRKRRGTTDRRTERVYVDEKRNVRVGIVWHERFLTGRMDKDFRRDYRKMRCALLHLLLIVGGKFHQAALSLIGGKARSTFEWHGSHLLTRS